MPSAYIPGRNVHNNLRSLKLIKQYCKEQKIKGLFVGVDARKAFDSVDHRYVPKFINWVMILNKKLRADDLVNGFRTEKVNKEQSAKQGDALSCSMFILCVDPLIRKINVRAQLRDPS